MKKLFLILFALTFSLYSCDDGSSSNSGSYHPSNSGSYHPSFQGARVRTVELKSYNGGYSFGFGTFYEGRMEVVQGSVKYKVTKCQTGKWNYMIFMGSSSIYFD